MCWLWKSKFINHSSNFPSVFSVILILKSVFLHYVTDRFIIAYSTVCSDINKAFIAMILNNFYSKKKVGIYLAETMVYTLFWWSWGTWILQEIKERNGWYEEGCGENYGIKDVCSWSRKKIKKVSKSDLKEFDNDFLDSYIHKSQDGFSFAVNPFRPYKFS